MVYGWPTRWLDIRFWREDGTNVPTDSTVYAGSTLYFQGNLQNTSEQTRTVRFTADMGYPGGGTRIPFPQSGFNYIEYQSFQLTPGFIFGVGGWFEIPETLADGDTITITLRGYVDGAESTEWDIGGRFYSSGGSSPPPVEPPAPETDIVLVDKWVNKAPEGSRLPLPVSVARNDNNSFEVGVSWKNNNPVYTRKVKPSVVVTAPDGRIISGPEASLYSTSPGETKSKEFNIAKVDKAGTWKVSIKLFYESNQVLAQFDGDCLIVSGPTGAITMYWFNQGSHRKASFGTEISADGQNFEVGIRYKNLTPRTLMAGVQVEVWNPSGIKQPTPPVDWPFLGIAYNEEQTKEYQFGSVNKTGEWTAKLTFLTKDDSAVLATWPADLEKGLLFKALPKATISDLKILAYRKKAPSAAVVGVAPGDVIEVDISFNYSVPADRTVNLTAGLYIPPGFDYPTQHNLSLEAGENKTKTATVEIPITADVGLKNDTYHLRVELEGLSDQVDNAVTVTGQSGLMDSLGAMVLMMLMMGMMSVTMEFAKDPSGTLKKGAEVAKKGAEAAAPVIKIFTSRE